MILKTERLKIRKFTESDLEDLSMLLADPEVMRFSLIGPQSREQTEKMLQERILAHYAQYGFGLCAVILEKEKRFIGLAGLIFQEVDGEQKPELGFRFLPKYWGNGYATEAAREICKYGFDTLKFDEIISIIDPKNIRSINVAKRLGMVHTKDTLFNGFSVGIYTLFKA